MCVSESVGFPPYLFDSFVLSNNYIDTKQMNKTKKIKICACGGLMETGLKK